MAQKRSRLPAKRSTLLYAAGLTALGAVAVSALLNARRARNAERANPPLGKFIDVNGVRLHYIERGSGEPLVLLHGNGTMAQDFLTSGLIDEAAKTYRVIAFDRPGYGHSSRPRFRIWTPTAQARLIHDALAKLGISQAIVLGHSWGAIVATRLALNHPNMVKSLVLTSGYYYPTVRADVLTQSWPAIPVVGDLLRYTVGPWLGRAMWPQMTRRMFGPQPVTPNFQALSKELATRPSQMRAAAAESLLMVPSAFAARRKYRRLSMPVIIVAGEEDRIANIHRQSERLHQEIPGSKLLRVPGAGHMVHQTANDEVMTAITEAAA
jgi:pimeloyl-ACP methyl ester carboxylesterase